MKKIAIICFLASFLISGKAHCQSVLKIDSFSITPAKFKIGDIVNLNVRIRNISKTDTCTDYKYIIYFNTAANHNPDSITTVNDSPLVNLAPGKSFIRSVSLSIDSNYFPPADTIGNIIVVWPTGIGLNGQPDPNSSFLYDSLPVKYSDSAKHPFLKIDSLIINNGKTFKIGDSVAISLKVKNVGTGPLKDPSVDIYLETIAHQAQVLVQNVTGINGLGLNQSKPVTFNYKIDSLYFPPADTINNIIVVWPTGIGVSGKPDANVGYTKDSIPVKYSDSAKQTTTSILLPANENADKSVKVYPNPAQDVFYIQSLNPRLDIKAVQIIDIAGKQITGWALNNNQINIANLPKGIYLISITVSDNNIARYKVVKE